MSILIIRLLVRLRVPVLYQEGVKKGEAPVIRGCTKLPRLDPNLIYPIDTGLVPHYTGHIPGESALRYERVPGWPFERSNLDGCCCSKIGLFTQRCTNILHATPTPLTISFKEHSLP